ncbi:MAG: efflux RND transporter permease subunit [Longimicrobiaceae bacterium]
MKLVDLAVRRPVTTAMFYVAVTVFGVVSLGRLPTELLPDLTFPTLTIQTEYPGVGPQEIETLVSRPIEEALAVVQGVQEVTSYSRPGRSEVVLTFRWGTDMDFAALAARERLDLLELPPDVTRSTLVRYDPSTQPVIRLALAGPAADPRTSEGRVALIGLRTVAEDQVERALEGLEGVAAVKVTGGLTEEIQVEVDQRRLAALGIPLEQVAERLAAENINLSGGILREGAADYVVRTVNEFADVPEIGATVVGTLGGQPILLRDVADVRRGVAERETISRVGGAEAVEVAVLREATANIVQVATEVRERVDTIRGDLPPGTRLTVVADQSTFIRQAVDDVKMAAVIGGVLAVVVLLLFLRHLPTVGIVALAIPLSVVATFILMFARGISLNVMSLGGLALGVGMLVDSAIVVLESVARERERGRGALEAARTGSERVGMAVVASTLTTVAVFLPIVFVRGVAGQLFGDQAWTVSFALLSSLVVSLTLIPMLAARGGGDAERVPERFGRTGVRARLGRGAVRAGGFAARLLRGGGGAVATGLRPVTAAWDRGYGWVERSYPEWIRAGLRRPARVLWVAGGIFAFSLLLIPGIGLELIPELDQGELVVELEAPPGTGLAAMEAITRRAENVALATPGVTEVISDVGVRGSGGTLGGGGEEERHAATLLVRLDRIGTDEARVSDRLSDDLGAIPGIAYRVERPRLFALAAPVEVEVRGYNLAALNAAAAEVRERLRSLPGIAETDEERRQGTPEVEIRFDRDRLARLGLTVGGAAAAVRDRVRGADATEFTERDRELNVLVRAEEEQRSTLADLANLRVELPAGGSVALGSIAELSFGEAPAEIVRRGGSRVALVGAQPAGRDLAGTLSSVEAEMRQVSLPADFTIAVGGQSRELDEGVRSMQLALLLAIFLVYLVMASQFESFLHPFVILFSVPLALSGALIALWVTRTPLSVVALIGIVMLAGIVVNNAIVLIDYVNQLRRDEGYALDEALVEAGRVRLRPILMSTLTTVLGLLPMALIRGEGAELRAPLAIPVIGGLVLSTLLTLIVVPVVYRGFEARRERRAAAVVPAGMQPAGGD